MIATRESPIDRFSFPFDSVPSVFSCSSFYLFLYSTFFHLSIYFGWRWWQTLVCVRVSVCCVHVCVYKSMFTSFAVFVCAYGFIPRTVREQKTQKPEMRWSIYWITWMAHIKHANENWKRKEKKLRKNNIRHTLHTHTDPYRLTLVNNFSFLFWRVCVQTHCAI